MTNPLIVRYTNVPLGFITEYEKEVLLGVEQGAMVWYIGFHPKIPLPKARPNPNQMPVYHSFYKVGFHLTPYHDHRGMIDRVHIEPHTSDDQQILETHYGRYRAAFEKNYGYSHRVAHRSAGGTPPVSPLTGTVTGRATFNSAFNSAIPFSRQNPPERAGVVAGEIIGIRGWWVIDGYLHSLAIVEAKWEPGITMRGDVENNEGVHAFKEKAELDAYLAECRWWDMARSTMRSIFHIDELAGPAPVVWGQVKLWGDVVEHELGYRAEFAKIVSLKTDEDEEGYLGDYELWQLKKRYGV